MNIPRTISLTLVCALFCAAVPAFPQNEILGFSSPSLLSVGPNASSVASPQADAVNPAASGGSQRTTVDLNYIALIGFGGSAGWGSALNGGFAYPTPVGVFTGSAHILSAAFPTLNFGTFGSLNLSVAKDLFPDLYVGAGLGFQIGATDWGLALDLGFVHAPGDLGFLKDFRWGIAYRGLGKGYPSVSASAAGVGTVPPVFTPDIGASFTLVKTLPFSLSLYPDLALPSTIKDMRLSLGLRILLFQIVTIDGSYTYDLADGLLGKAPAVPLAFGVSVNLKPLVSPKTGDLVMTASAAPLQDGVVAAGLGVNMAFGPLDTNPPLIKSDFSNPAYISPGTASSQGDLVLPFTIADERYIKGYRLVITDALGKAVRSMQAVDNGPASTGFQNFIDRFGAVKKNINMPPSLSWDGKDDSGAVVPNGSYTYALEAWDDNGNTARTDPGTVTVDTAAPVVTVNAPYVEFSPSGESTKGALVIQQSGSVEDLWVGTIRDATGREVRQFRWNAESPKTFQWLGKDASGKIVADGTYSYVVTSTDRAGNTSATTLEAIVVNTQATPVSLSSDLSAFSPNGDGIMDTLVLIPEVKVRDGIVKWTLTVRDQESAVRRTFTREGTVPSSVTFDGKGDDRSILPEGMYRGSLNVLYGNGRTPNTDSPPFLLRTTPPSATVSASYKEFSPDGVGTKTILPVEQSGSPEQLWTGTFRTAVGQVVKSMSWDEGAPGSFSWDGRDDAGTLVPDGIYSYRLTSTDPAGNSGSASIDRIVVNTLASPAAVSLAETAFSPNGDGVKDVLRLGLKVPVTAGVETWNLTVTDLTGQAVRRFSGTASLPAAIDFDGKDDVGTPVPEGSYSAALSITYANGHHPSAVSPPFVLDVTGPTVSASTDYTVFSPGGTRGSITFTQSGAKDAAWAGSVQNASGKEVFTSAWKDVPAHTFVFDGRGADGKTLPDGAYTYLLVGTDRAGNVGRTGPLEFEIDTTKATLSVSTDLAWLSPNGDGVKDAISIIPSRVPDGVVTFELRVSNDKGIVVRRMTGKDAAPVEFAWDGMDDSRLKVPDGRYTAELEILFRNGDRPVVGTNPFFVDTVAPSIVVAVDVLLFSPSEGSSLTAIAVRQSSSEEDEWRGAVMDSAGQSVRGYSWSGRALDFLWDGKDDNGNIVPDGSYRYGVSSVDRAGNRTVRALDGIRVDTRPTPISVKAASDGFSPNGDGFRDTMGFNLSAGLKEGVTSWKLSMIATLGGVLKTFGGTGSIPETVAWDGKTESGKVVEGTWSALLEVSYEKGNRPVARTAPFLLSVTPPKLNFDAGPLPFSPDGDGYNDLLAFSLKAQGASPVTAWSILVLDPENHFFNSFSGTGAPAGAMTWDGLSANGELVESAQDYTFLVTVKDALGNTATLSRPVPVDVLVFRDGDRLKVRITSITFQANTADYTNVPADRADRNIQTLKRLAQIFTRYSQYEIRIEGHAVMVYWDNPAEGKKEQDIVLIPLSKDRADAIRSALIKLGIDGTRITTEGIGGAQPIVPFSDLENRWKDRRVEFILLRE